MDPGSLVVFSVLSFALETSEIISDRAEVDRNQSLALRAAGMWKGYRGSARSRPGLRQHSDGFWYPKRAFEPVCVDLDSGKACVTDHIGWCRSKYWSYRSSDDTFQPYTGERRRCVSPLSPVPASPDAADFRPRASVLS